MASHSLTDIHAAAGDKTVRAKITTTGIPIPGKKGDIYTLTAIELTVYGVLTTVVNLGGLAELENDSIDWRPFEVYTNLQTTVGASGANKVKPKTYVTNLPLPAGSTVYVYYTAQNAANQKLAVTLFYETKPFSGKWTNFISGIGAAITQVTVALAHVSIAVPTNKGGIVKEVITQVWGVLTTLVCTGGKVVGHCKSADPSWEDLEFYTCGLTTITESGCDLEVQHRPYNLHLPQGTTATFDYTPQNALSQKLSVTLAYERQP